MLISRYGAVPADQTQVGLLLPAEYAAVSVVGAGDFAKACF